MWLILCKNHWTSPLWNMLSVSPNVKMATLENLELTSGNGAWRLNGLEKSNSHQEYVQISISFKCQSIFGLWSRIVLSRRKEVRVWWSKCTVCRLWADIHSQSGSRWTEWAKKSPNSRFMLSGKYASHKRMNKLLQETYQERRTASWRKKAMPRHNAVNYRRNVVLDSFPKRLRRNAWLSEYSWRINITVTEDMLLRRGIEECKTQDGASVLLGKISGLYNWLIFFFFLLLLLLLANSNF